MSIEAINTTLGGFIIILIIGFINYKSIIARSQELIDKIVNPAKRKYD